MNDVRRMRIGFASNAASYDGFARGSEARAAELGDFSWAEFDEPWSYTGPPPPNPDAEKRLRQFASDLDVLIICHGSPRVSAQIMDGSSRLRMIGDVDGDRFAHRIDLGAAAARDIIVVDTTHGSAASVAEWTLALMLIALRNAGALFRRLIAGEPVMVSASDWRGDASFRNGELFNKRVGLIGCGHIGRRLLELVEPFSVKTMVSDPHLPKVMADAYGFEFGDLDQVLSENEVVVCLAPLTERTRGMIGARELALLKPGSVFVNSSRGAIVDSAALIERLAKGDIVAALDVFDPEPIPTDSPIRSAPNAFVSPHIAANVWQAEPRCFNLMLDEVERLAAGREPLNALVAVGRPQGGLVPVLRD